MWPSLTQGSKREDETEYFDLLCFDNILCFDIINIYIFKKVEIQTVTSQQEGISILTCQLREMASAVVSLIFLHSLIFNH